MTNEPTLTYDVAIIGGGAAGLSAALTLSRARRRVAVIDGGDPRNAPAAGIHGLLGREGIAPGAFLAAGRAEVTSYGGEILTDTVTRLDRNDSAPGFVIDLAQAGPLHARHVLVATGLRDELPPIPGVAEQWGRGVLHCPYCHGWEVRDQRIGVLATGPLSVHQAVLFSQWSPQVTFFAGNAAVESADLLLLAAAGVAVVSGAIEAVVSADGALTHVGLAGGTTHPTDAIVVATTMRARLDGLTAVGLTATENAFGDYVETDSTGRTAVDGIWAAGNVTDQSAQVGAAAADGVRVAAQINAAMIFADAAARQQGH